MKLRIVLALVLLCFGSARSGHAQLDDPSTPRPLDHVLNSEWASEVKYAYSLGLTSPTFVETTWVGHVQSGSGSGAPWFIGIGPNRPGASPNGYWGWDNRNPACSDSLMGWLPIRRAYTLTGGLTLSDADRTWWALDYGNQANYVPNRGSPARTFGVPGVWHVDGGAGVPGPTLAPPTWTPIAGQGSAWCGLRAHGDASYVDPSTGNAFNQSVLEYNGENASSPGHTNKNFPGYASQWDQMLYRDIQVADGTSLAIDFDYRTRMSTDADRSAATRTGWFNLDPLSPFAGNFVSSTLAGPQAPVDSFMVYIGVPANPADCVGSDGLSRAIGDLQRRWFSEVVAIDAPYHELASAAGNNSAHFGTVISAGQLAPLLADPRNPGPGGVIRLVFRVKTNRGYDDQSSALTGYSSGTEGAALVDNVQMTAGASFVAGTFETPGEIDNQPESGGRALQAWKSTGKPPAVYFHLRDVSELQYDDVCGAVGGAERVCDLSGAVISSGNFDQAESAGGTYGTADQEVMDGLISPTINLVTTGPPNEVGLTPAIVDATDDFYVKFDTYTGAFDLPVSGNAWTIGIQSYPATQPNGVKAWGEIRTLPYQLFDPRPECFSELVGAFNGGLVRTSNPNGIPDSIRIFIGRAQQCFRFGVTTGCSTTRGGYFDNVALGFADVRETTDLGNTPAARSIAFDLAHRFCDAFPFNRVREPLDGAGFDTTSALILTGHNTQPRTGTINDQIRLSDSSLVTAIGSDTRLDLVFRIRPGPGNYVVIGDPSSGLRRTPTSAVAAAPGDGSFWGEYLASHDGGSGAGTPGGHPGGNWSDLVWNAARCDTAERNVFPVRSLGNVPGIVPGVWASTYHESDPRFTALGIPRHRCFVVDTAGAAEAPNLTCSAEPAWLTTVPVSRTGYDGNALTREFTKIIPDGLLTPGSHVQYFYRRSHASDAGMVAMAPDTSVLIPQRSEGRSFSPHRWHYFGVLPDRWAFRQIPPAAAAALDSASARTTPPHANDEVQCEGGLRLTIPLGDGFFRGEGAKFGLYGGGTWRKSYSRDGTYGDFRVKAGGYVDIFDANLDYGGFAEGDFELKHWNKDFTLDHKTKVELLVSPQTFRVDADSRTSISPSDPMLKYIEGVYTFSARGLGTRQPYVDMDFKLTDMIDRWSQEATQAARKHWWLLDGDFLEGAEKYGYSDPFWFWNRIGGLRSDSYLLLSGSTKDPGDLETVLGGTPFDQDIFGFRNRCVDRSSVLEPNPALPHVKEVARYGNQGTQGPYVAGLMADYTSTNLFRIMMLGTPLGGVGSRMAPLRAGLRAYFYKLFSALTDQTCPVVGPPDSLVAVEGEPSPANSVRLLGNPTRGGGVRIELGLARSERVVVKIRDIAGRVAATLLDEIRAPGVHQLGWDGTTEAGHPATPGVYFLEVRRTGSRGVEARKLILLR